MPFQRILKDVEVVTLRKELGSFSEDAVVFPHIIADKAWIYLNGVLIGETSGRNGFAHHSNFVFEVPEGIKGVKNTLVVQLRSRNFVAITKAPYLGNYDFEQLKSNVMDFFNSKLWLFTAGMGLILALITLLLGGSPFAVEKQNILGWALHFRALLFC